MDTQQQRENLIYFCINLPENVQNELGKINLDIFIKTNEICSKHSLLLYETGHICEGVRRVLSGDDSQEDFISFISQDKNIETDNRPKIQMIADEIQKSIFSIVIPILKQNNLPIKQATEKFITTTNQVQDNLSKTQQDDRHLKALLRIASGTAHSEDELKERFETLPQGLQRAIASVDTANAVQGIAKRFFLHVDQMAALSSETGLVLIGLTHPRDFVKNLSTRLRVSEQRALEIAKEINAQVLIKVKEALRGLHETQSQEKKIQPISQELPQKPVTKPLENKLDILTAQASSATKPVPQTTTALQADWNINENAPVKEKLLTEIENPREIVGPTGWKPAQKTNSGTPQDNKTKITQNPTKGAAPDNMLSKKLSEPVTLPREERNYTIDPYREPLE